MKTNFILLLFMAFGFICNAQSKENLQLVEARKAIEASNNTYQDLLNKRDGSILSRYTEDACLLPPNSSILCGRNELLDYFKVGSPRITKFTIIELFDSGNDYVTEISTYEMFDTNMKKVDEGKIMVIWKKTIDGWKMHRDMFSSSIKQ